MGILSDHTNRMNQIFDMAPVMGDSGLKFGHGVLAIGNVR